VSGYHIREAGSTAVQEVAFTLADGIAYAEAAIAAGLKVDEFAPRISFFFNAHNNLLEEIAKFRAARRLWARTMRERFGARDPLSGSYAIEHLTDEIERRAVDYIDRIDAMGGMLHAIDGGYVQREIQEAAYNYQRAVETGDAIVVGVNRFQVEEEPTVSVLRVDP